MTISASFLVNGTLPNGPVLLTAGTTATVALVSSASVSGLQWSFIGTSESVTLPTFSITNATTATFVVPAAPTHGLGLSMVLQCVNGGQYSTALVCVGATGRVSAMETNERGAPGYWAWPMNVALVASQLGAGNTALPQTAIISGSGTTALWSYTVPVSTDIIVAIDPAPAFSDASGRRWSGAIECRARRIGSGSLVVDPPQFAGGIFLSPNFLSPTFAANGNTLEFRVTANVDGYDVIPRATVSVVTCSTASDPVSSLVALRATVLADSPTRLYYADVGLTPATPSVGNSITAWADQSTNAAATTCAAITYALDGVYPNLLSQGLGYTATAAAAPAHGNWTFCWTSTKTNPATATQELLFASGSGRLAIMLHSAPSSWATGTHVVVFDGTNVYDLGVCPTGKHHFGVTLNHSTMQATLYIDGVAGTPITYTEGPAPTSYWYFGAGAFGPQCNLFGWEVIASVSTTAIAHWYAMATVAWGAHA